MANDSDEKGKTQKPSTSDDPECIFRVLNILSYFTVLVLIGIPIWWYTTRVYRASLPLDEMFDVTIYDRADKHFGIPLSLEYDILITVVNPDPENLKVQLDGEDLAASVQPFLDRLAHIADFVVKSQHLYLVELGAIPRKVIDHYVLTEEQLPHVITPLEKKLWSHLSPRPCINLVLYVSHCEVPLFIENKESSNAFLSPRWGGIYIVNPDKASCDNKTFEPDLKLLASTFVTQLTKLLQMKGSSNDHIFNLQVRKTSHMIDSTKRTLKSLAQLLLEINSIVISDDVAKKIQIAIDNVKIAEEFYEKHFNVPKAHEFAKVAFKNAEAAFSDPSLLALLYFPDDQKYAVYIPLFLPVMIPVLMSLVTVRKWFKEKKINFD